MGTGWLALGPTLLLKLEKALKCLFKNPRHVPIKSTGSLHFSSDGTYARFRMFISSVAVPECVSRIPDPNFFHPGSRVKKIPGSQIRISIKDFKYLN
jgi:hypothetical protein